MANTVQLSPEILSVIAAQVSAFWHAVGGEMPREGQAEIGESFQIWMLTGIAVVSGATMAEAAPTGRWHHQVYRQRRPDAHAYSRPIGPGVLDWQLTALFQSDVANAINAAVDVVDGAFPGDVEARLLLIPSYGIQCIWVVTGKAHRLVPAVVPLDYREAVVPFNIYEDHDFLARLRRYPYVQGIVT